MKEIRFTARICADCLRATSLLLGAAFALSLFLVPLAHADAKADSEKQYQHAVKMRTMLEGYLDRDRSLSDYKETVLAFRKVYLITPEAPDATPALVAEAELYQAMGRLFDAKYFQDAIGRYNFLLKQYPGTKFRADALFAVGKIQEDDLKKRTDAQETFQEVLKRYPRSGRVADAQQALKELAGRGNADANSTASKAQPSNDSQQKVSAETSQIPGKAGAGPGEETDKSEKSDKANRHRVENVDDSQPDLQGQAVEPRVGDRTSSVTRVQTWNSPGSTRIIVTLNDTIKYESARIASPDRIYFNLYKAQVGQKLSRKALDVNDGLLESVRIAQNKADVVRLVLNVNGEKDYSAFLLAKPYRLVIDIHSRGTSVAKAATENPSPQAVASVSAPANASNGAPAAAAPMVAAAPVLEAGSSKENEVKTKKDNEVKSVASLAAPDVDRSTAKTEKVEKTDKSLADQPATKTQNPADQPPGKVAEKTILPLSKKAGRTAALLQPPSESKPMRDGQRSLTRALGLKINRIVIDAGHGGHDTGTIGPHGLMEKDLCLDVALRLGALIEQKLPGAEVVYTRTDDTFIPLEERTAIANRAQADLFISIHANSSHDGSARGIETYYLNFATTEDAMEVASRENALSQESLHDLQDIIKKIARNDKMEESKELASDIQDSLTQRLQLVSRSERNRGVKKAPFVVLIGANMPSVLSEISFVSNPSDERLLRKSDQRERVADGLYRGISAYLDSLNSLSNNKQKLVSDNPADAAAVAANGNPK